MTAFAKWWESADNPCRDLPSSTREQMKDYMRAAFAAGKKDERNKRIVREADFIDARNMFKSKPL